MSRSLFYNIVETRLGNLIVGATEKGICSVTFGSDDEAFENLSQWAKKRAQRDSLRNEQTDLLREASQQLREYFEGERMSFTAPIDMYGTTFQQKVWRQLLQIPYGSVQSYKEVALAIDSPKAVRAVGGANNKNPLSIIVPCHRVIGADGSLIGYGGGIETKKFLLELERKVVRREMS